MNWREYLKKLKDNEIKSLVIIGSSKYNQYDLRKLENIIEKVKDCQYFIILPDRGVYFEFAKKLRNYLDKEQRFVLTIPKEDKTFGIEHLKS